MSSETLIHVIDDDAAMRESLAFLLESAGYAARTHESAVAFLANGVNQPGGCIVTDVRMPGMNGVELARHLRDHGLTMPIVMITGHGDVPLAVESMKAGVADFLEKPFDDEALLRAIRSAMMAHTAAPGSGPAATAAELEAFAALSPRERDVLGGMVAGKANKVIAYDLGISPRTVEVYRANVMSKTGAGSLAELVRMALAAGIS